MAQWIALISLVAAPLFGIVALVIHPSPDRPFGLSGVLIALGFLISTWMATISFVRPSTWTTDEDPLVDIESVDPRDLSLEVTLKPIHHAGGWFPPVHLNTHWDATIAFGEAQLPASGRVLWEEYGSVRARALWDARPSAVQPRYVYGGPQGVRNDVIYFDRFRRNSSLRQESALQPTHLEVRLSIYNYDEIPIEGWSERAYFTQESAQQSASEAVQALVAATYGEPDERWYLPPAAPHPWNLQMEAKLYWKDREIWNGTAVAASTHYADDHVFGVFAPEPIGEARERVHPRPFRERHQTLFLIAYAIILLVLLATGILVYAHDGWKRDALVEPVLDLADTALGPSRTL